MTALRMLALALTVLAAGCVSSPPARIYVLGNPPSPVAAAATLSGRPVVKLLPVSVPDYLDTRDILVRSGRNEVTASRSGRWAERLSVGMTHSLAAALGVRLGASDIVVGDRAMAPPTQQILVTVESFEIRPDGQCLVMARWVLSSGEGGRVLHSEGDTLIEQAADPGDAAVAAAMTQAIDRLADRIAAWAHTQ